MPAAPTLLLALELPRPMSMLPWLQVTPAAAEAPQRQSCPGHPVPELSRGICHLPGGVLPSQAYGSKAALLGLMALAPIPPCCASLLLSVSTEVPSWREVQSSVTTQCWLHIHALWSPPWWCRGSGGPASGSISGTPGVPEQPEISDEPLKKLQNLANQGQGPRAQNICQRRHARP